MISVIFPAAGKGKRTGLSFNKIFADFLGQPLFVHTLKRFSSFAQIDEAIIVAAADEISLIENILQNYQGLLPYKIVAGGVTRQDSVLHGLQAVSDAASLVLIHDMARPFVTETVVKNVIEGTLATGAAIAAIPVTDTIKVVDAQHAVVQTPLRSTLQAIQTPQGFRKELLLAAYAQIQTSSFIGTDDASLLEHCQQPVVTVPGDPCNIKITSPVDLLFAKALFAAQAPLEEKEEVTPCE